LSFLTRPGLSATQSKDFLPHSGYPLLAVVFLLCLIPAILHHYDALLMHGVISMKAITLRSVPPRVAKAIRKEAAAKGLSINKTVISLLEGRTTAKERKKGRKTLHRELDSLAGSWSEKEAADFDKALAVQRTIDPDLWK
jgi:hypothetical protein